MSQVNNPNEPYNVNPSYTLRFGKSILENIKYIINMAKIKLSADDNKYFATYYDTDLNILELTWYEESEDMEDQEYKDLNLEVIQKIESLDDVRIDLYYLDNRNFLFSMSPELQEWQAANLSVKLNLYSPNPELIKAAVLVSKDFISQLSIEQAIEEDQATESNTKYFEEEEEARAWLMSEVIDMRKGLVDQKKVEKVKQNYAKVDISSNEYFVSHFDPSLNAYEGYWSAKSNEISEEKYKSLMKENLDAISVNIEVETIFLDFREFTPLDLTDWFQWYVDTVIMELIKHNPNLKVAIFIKDKDNMSTIALQQVTMNDASLEKVMLYFDDEKEAREWLMNI